MSQHQHTCDRRSPHTDPPIVMGPRRFCTRFYVGCFSRFGQKQGTTRDPRDVFSEITNVVPPRLSTVHAAPPTGHAATVWLCGVGVAVSAALPALAGAKEARTTTMLLTMLQCRFIKKSSDMDKIYVQFVVMCHPESIKTYEKQCIDTYLVRTYRNNSAARECKTTMSFSHFCRRQ